MARTRGAADIAARENGDDELTPILGDGTLVEVPVVDGEPQFPVVAPPPVYTCDPSTLDRNMEASELAEILARVLGGWSITIPHDEWSAMRPDVRRHFKRTV